MPLGGAKAIKPGIAGGCLVREEAGGIGEGPTAEVDFQTGGARMGNRRQALKGLTAGVAGRIARPLVGYSEMVGDARALGTSRIPKLKITEVRAVELRGINSKYVRVYTDQGLTGTGEMVDTVGASRPR